MKKRLLFGLGAAIAGAASALAVKIMMDRDYRPATGSQEKENEDRGVAPIATEKSTGSEKKTNGVADLKADAINHGYQPLKY